MNLFRILLGFLCFLAIGFKETQAAVPVPTSGTLPVQAKSALLYDVASGRILYQRAIETPYAPASTTKLLTALLVYEKSRLNGEVQVTAEDTHVEPSHIPLVTGETVSVRNLVRALLIGSDNDSAMALARYVGGSVSNFVRMMNLRAAALGCRHTVFKNPNGLPAYGQVTTSADLLKIFQAAIAIPALRDICQTPSFYLATASRHQIIRNHNHLLGTYPGMGPAKTGWTYASRHTYAASATRNGRELQLIILNSPNKWNDARTLFNYGFSHLPPLEPSQEANASRLSPENLTIR